MFTQSNHTFTLRISKLLTFLDYATYGMESRRNKNTLEIFLTTNSRYFFCCCEIEDEHITTLGCLPPMERQNAINLES